MKNKNFVKLLPFYYTLAVALFLMGYVAINNKINLKTAQSTDKSFAAEPVYATSAATLTTTKVINELNGVMDKNSNGTSSAYFGGTTRAYLGLHFPNISIPANGKITKAYLSFTSQKTQWIGQSTKIFAEKSTTPLIFSNASLPSSRTLTTTNVAYADNTNWKAGTQYNLPLITNVISEAISASTTKNVNVILQGQSTQYARKFIYGSSDPTKAPKLVIEITTTSYTAPTVTTQPTPSPKALTTTAPVATTKPATTPLVTTAPSTTTHTMSNGESMAMMQWQAGAKNAPNPQYDKCDDGTDVVTAHKMYYVVAYDGIKYPTWHPPVVTNPVTGVGKCYFGHEHGSSPSKYMYYNEIVQHFGKDLNGDGTITAMTISDSGVITPGDRAGLPFGIANEHMDMYYNQEGRDSIFVRHEDHVGHKVEFVNNEAEMQGNSTHTMTQLAGTNGVNIPYYNSSSGDNSYKATGVACTHLHKFHQGTNSADAVRNNLHETIFHSKCQSVDVNGINAPAYYPNNEILLTGMTAFGKPGEYKRFCFSSRDVRVCPDGQNTDGSCIINDPLISKLPNAINSNSLGRNMVDKYCLDNFSSLNPGANYFNPYELWEGDFGIFTSSGRMIAEHGRQWDVLDPVRYVDASQPGGVGYVQDRCNAGLPFSGNCAMGTKGAAWNSPQAAYKGLIRTAYFGRNRISNQGGASIYWTDPIGGNAVTTQFTSGLKQKLSTVEADIQKVQSRVQQLYGSSNFLNDRALQRRFNDGNGTVHAPN